MASFALVISLSLGLLGHDWLAGVIGTTTVVGLVTAFIIGKKEVSESEKV